MPDTLFADVSEWQVGVNDSYPYRVISIRANDGTHRDVKWANNYGWCKRATDRGDLDFFIVYFVWRPNWQAAVSTLKDLVGTPHPRMVVMMDIESWEGQIRGNQSDGINRAFWDIANWLGDPRRVIGYANQSDFDNLWPQRPEGLRMVGAGYGVQTRLAGQIVHQYTNGEGYGRGLPEGCAPFGKCDMNSADGLDSVAFAQACGIFIRPQVNAIDEKYKVSSWLGVKLTTEVELPTPDGVGRYAVYENGHIYWTPDTGAHPIPARLFESYAALGFEKGALGYPVADHAVLPDGDVQAFQYGVLFRKYPAGGHYVTGLIGDHYAKTGYEAGPLGWPTSNEIPFQGGIYQEFERGRLAWSPDGTVALSPGSAFI